MTLGSEIMLQATGLTCQRSRNRLFDNLCFSLDSSEILHVRGANGSGKSTLLRILMGLFTDYEGNKGKQISASPHVALTFWWAKTNKQIRIEGECSKVSEKENDEYFSSRPRGSQISASVSLQSQELESYESLTQKSESFEKEHSNKTIERPERWGGFIVAPISIEFWIDQKNRLHKRELYSKSGTDWKKALLSP